jgi:excisionase family DNA binding protein
VIAVGAALLELDSPLYKPLVFAYGDCGTNITSDFSGCRASSLVFCLSKSQQPARAGSGAIAMTAKQAAAELQISLSFLYKLLDQGEIAFERRGKRKLPIEASVAEYRRRNLVPAQPKPNRPVKGSAYEYKHLSIGNADCG